MSKVDLKFEGRVAVLTLDNPDKMNAIDLEMATEMAEAVAECEGREETGAIVVTGRGRGFCAGAILGAIENADEGDFKRIYRAFMCVAESPLPTIAAVNGAAVGAGMNMALACDVRVAAEGAKFVTRFLELGLHPGGGHTWMLGNAVGTQTARAMLLCGEELDGPASAARGLTYSCVPDEELLPTALGLAAKAADAPRELAIRAKRTLVAMGAVDRHADALELELEAQLWSSRQSFYAERMAALKNRISAD